MARAFDELRPIGERPGRLTPQDPMVDTFRQRFAPFSSDPVGDYRELIPSRIIHPGTRERFGDPTKVISMIEPRALGGPVEPGKPYLVGENGPEIVVPKEPATVVADATGLPPGFKYVDEEPAPGSNGLPPGFRYVDEGSQPPAPQPGPPASRDGTPPMPAPNAGQASLPDDPAERAAMTLKRSASGARQEGAATRFIDSIAPAAGREVNRVAGIAKEAVQTGDIAPKEALESALMVNPASVAARTAAGAARLATTPLEAAQRETGVMSIPRAAVSGEGVQTMARGLAQTPAMGGGIRNAARAATEELQAAGAGAAGRPTGEIADQAVAGSKIKAALSARQDLSPPLAAMTKGSAEDVIGDMIRMAGSRQGADIQNLARLRRLVPAEAHGEVQSALITRLGTGTRGEFDPNQWVRSYGTLSDRGKNVLFGVQGSELRRHLDAIEEVSRRAPNWQQFNRRPSALGAKLTVGAMVGAAWVSPMTLIAAAIPVKLLARSLAKPATAAPLAQWSRAYERVARTNGAPQALASFGLAVKNLNSNLGTDIDPRALLQGAQSAPTEE